MLRRPLSLAVLSILLSGLLAGCLADGRDEEGTDPKKGADVDEGGERERGSVSGVVLGLEGPVEGANVDLSRVFRSTQTGPDGRFRFDDLLATDYRVSVSADHHRRASQTVEVDGDVDVQIELKPIMLTETVPAKYGKQVVAVNEQDTLFTSAGLPLVGRQQAVTNQTLENTFPGFWEIVPEDGYRVAQVTVVVAWAPIPELEQGLALHYFRGESLAANEIAEGAATEYHVPEPAIDGQVFAYYTIQNEDWDSWGQRNWQIGVFVREGEHPVAAGAAVEHIINVVVTLVDEGYTPDA